VVLITVVVVSVGFSTFDNEETVLIVLTLCTAELCVLFGNSADLGEGKII
jgi:hypothetical protein